VDFKTLKEKLMSNVRIAANVKTLQLEASEMFNHLKPSGNYMYHLI
jgi:hypothetical protein